MVPRLLFESINTAVVLQASPVGSPKMLPMKQVGPSSAKMPAASTPIAIMLLLCPIANSGIVTDSDIVMAVDDRISGLFTHSGVVIAGCVTIERVITHGCIFCARCVRFHGVITERIIFVAVHIACERITAKGVVEVCRLRAI